MKSANCQFYLHPAFSIYFFGGLEAANACLRGSFPLTLTLSRQGRGDYIESIIPFNVALGLMALDAFSKSVR